jgi:sialate O-acetylesterase
MVSTFLKKLGFLILFSSEIASLEAAIRLPAIFGDNMILQQQQEVTIWGWAKANAKVKITTEWNDRSVFTEAGKDGKWSAKINTPASDGKNYSITISDGDELILRDVLMGEVWVCAGQSNMEMPMIGYGNQPVTGALDAIVKSSNNKIRLFSVKRNYDIVALDDCEGKWNTATPESVGAFSAAAYFFAKRVFETTGVPIGLINASWGGASIRSFMSKEILPEFNLSVEERKENIQKPNQSPATIFNAMIHPIIGYRIRGVLWYQGETDKWMPEQYVKMFQSMVNDWRNRWKQGDFPFYYAQIAPYEKGTKNAAFFREAQEKCMQIIPNVGMAVLMDSNSPDCIHPAMKKEAGERLAYWALAETYKIKGIPYRSPAIRDVQIVKDTVCISFNDAARGLTSFGKQVSSMVIAGDDKKWYPATEVRLVENKIYVFSESVKKPVAVRYAFTSYAPGEIFSTLGLPVSSFRTDDWEE